MWLFLVAAFPLAGALLYGLIRPARTRAERRAQRYRCMYLESLLPVAPERRRRAAVRAARETEIGDSAPAPDLARLVALEESLGL
jgi:hypothetical protein